MSMSKATKQYKHWYRSNGRVPMSKVTKQCHPLVYFKRMMFMSKVGKQNGIGIDPMVAYLCQRVKNNTTGWIEFRSNVECLCH